MFDSDFYYVYIKLIKFILKHKLDIDFYKGTDKILIFDF